MPKVRSPSPPATSPCPTPPPESQALTGLTIHVVNAKLSPSEIGEMFSLAQNASAKLSSTPQNAAILITALTMKRRLERHISWDVASTKHIVSPQWLRACVEQDKLLPFSQFETIKSERRVSAPGPSASISNSAAFSTHAPVAAPSRSKAAVPKGDHTHPLSTHRRSPLVCPNQALCEQLATIMKSRSLEGEVNKELSYSRAIAAIKSYPTLITSADEVRKLPGIGAKTSKLIGEFIKTGSISDAQQIASSKRFQILSEFTAIHGIGPSKAREHYEAGCRNVEDLVEIYESKRKGPQVAGILAALELREELSVRIPRSEVESAAQRVFNELDAIQPGCEYTICGSYRRGKPDNSDIDIVFTHRKAGIERHLCTRLVDRLCKIGVVTHVLNQSSYTSNHENVHGRHKETRACMDVLDKALVILKTPDMVHRRVDLIFAPYSVYWTAVLGWTGSKQFERDLRIHAKQKSVSYRARCLSILIVLILATLRSLMHDRSGMKFDSGGITRQRDSEPIMAYSEQDVFKELGLEYVEPEMRNADV
ncbi:hypothetical protein FRC07_005413 [Ceratobasidium sp. 392]|nr:hypothetical protein FRC07_005413 [Ceratobasidium sp. 392]